jgi:AcrR family transcriptional regulator
MTALDDSAAGLRPRARVATVARNDELILDAIVDELAEVGWGHLTVAAVARRAGMTHRAVLPRYSDRSQMAVAAWEHRCSSQLEAGLALTLEAKGDFDALLTSFRGFDSNSASMRAGAELLIARQFDAPLATSVEQTLGRQLRSWLTAPSTGPKREVERGISAFLLCNALGLLIVRRLPLARKASLRQHARDVVDAVGSPTIATKLPTDRAEHMDWLAFTQTPGATTGNADHDAILDAALVLVGTVGYEAATMSKVARMAHINESVIFAHYRTKLDLFMDATLRQWKAGLPYNDAFAARIAQKHGAGVAEATLMREAQRPGREHIRSLALEQIRVAWREPALANRFESMIQQYAQATRSHSPGLPQRDALSRIVGEFSVSQGVVLLGQLFPQAWTIGLDPVFVPMTKITSAVPSH